MWTTIAEVANAARLTDTVAPDRIIADQASFPIRMWKGFQIVLVILSYFNKIGREIIWDFVSVGCMTAIQQNFKGWPMLLGNCVAAGIDKFLPGKFCFF